MTKHDGRLPEGWQQPRRSEPMFSMPPTPVHLKYLVPYAYQFKWDGPWCFLLLFSLIAVFNIWAAYHFGDEVPAISIIVLVVSAFIALLRCVVWCCFRFPMTSFFFIGFVRQLLGFGGRRR
jgi:hypothetical protein